MVASIARNTRLRHTAFGSVRPRGGVTLVPSSLRSAPQQPRREVTLRAKKGGGGAGAASSSDVDLDVVFLQTEEDTSERMQKCIKAVADTFNTMRTGRANPAILDRILVDYYGAPTPLKSIASISIPDASTLMISPFDRTAIRDVEKAINESDLGINPNNDGERIRLNIPPMTQDRRKELCKKAAKATEDGKVAVRNVRKDVLKKLDKYDWPQDRKKDLEASIQKLTDAGVKQLDDLLKTKTDDIMKI